MAWALDPNRGSEPPLVLNPDYINGFYDGVNSIQTYDGGSEPGLSEPAEGIVATLAVAYAAAYGIPAAIQYALAAAAAAAAAGESGAASVLQRVVNYLEGEAAEGTAAGDEAGTAAAEEAAAEGEAAASAARDISFDAQQLQTKFGHAGDFGIEGNYDAQNAAQFEQTLNNFVQNAPNQIQGTYRGQPAIFYVDPESGLMVMTTPSGEFWSAWKLSPQQLWNVLNRGTL